jgi:2-hydroxycyclohexanecarboxyl-CoA dehydrogenase
MATTRAIQELADSAVVIAGGTSGAGLASARAFADAGVRRIALLARNKARGVEAGKPVLARCPTAMVEFIPVDAMSPTDTVAAIKAAHERLGTVDVLVNSVTSLYANMPARSATNRVSGAFAGQAVGCSRSASASSWRPETPSLS